MILLTVLVLLAVTLIVAGVIALLASGTAFILVFSDVIACVLVLYLIRVIYNSFNEIKIKQRTLRRYY